MSKIYVKNTYFNNNSISIHLGETQTTFFVETNIDNKRTTSRFKKVESDAKERMTKTYVKKLHYISKIIELTKFNLKLK